MVYGRAAYVIHVWYSCGVFLDPGLHPVLFAHEHQRRHIQHREIVRHTGPIQESFVGKSQRLWIRVREIFRKVQRTSKRTDRSFSQGRRTADHAVSRKRSGPCVHPADYQSTKALRLSKGHAKGYTAS